MCWQTLSMSRMTSSFQKRRMVQPILFQPLCPRFITWRCIRVGMLRYRRLRRRVSSPGKRSRRCNRRSEIVSGTQAPSVDAREARSRASVRHRSVAAHRLGICTISSVAMACDGIVSASRKIRTIEVAALRRPPLSCRTSPPLGGRSAVVAGFANRQRRKRGAVGETANLPPCGGDVRQDRGGRCPANVAESYSPLYLPRRHALARDRILAVLQLHALRQKLVADAVGLGPVLGGDQFQAPGNGPGDGIFINLGRRNVEAEER